MRSTRQERATRCRGDRGTALIESAVILPVIVLIVFGIVEIGFLFRSATIVSTSTRSGARVASEQYGSAKTAPQIQAVLDTVQQSVEKDLQGLAAVDTPVDLWIYKANAAGDPQSGNYTSCGSPCIVYTWNAVTKHFVYSSGSWALGATSACGPVHDAVGVYVKATHKPIGFSSTFGTFTMREHTVMRLEPDSTASCPTGL